jgi:hypothetical protein
VLDDRTGFLVELDFDFCPYHSGAGMRLYQEEGAPNAVVTLYGLAPKDPCAPGRKYAAGLITIVGCVQSVFGYPDENTFCRDPRGEVGRGFFEVIESQWAANLDDYNKRAHGREYFSHMDRAVRHFFVGSKDGSVQFLARDIRFEVFFPQSSEFLEEEAQRRLRSWGHRRIVSDEVPFL